jgi:ABC-2 type transport system ATP-binding protein
MEMHFRECVAEARDRGQTVFLSSHVLSEVEAVCDRVAILRRGRLVDVGTLDDLRTLKSREVRVVFADAPGGVMDGVEGVTDVAVDGTTARCRLRGEPGPLLAALAGRRVISLDIREPSLEEMFLAFYGPDGGAPEADRTTPEVL